MLFISLIDLIFFIKLAVNISIAVAVLPLGTFAFKVIISDLEGISATDTVLVNVLPPHGREAPGFDGLMVLSSLGVLAIASVMIRKKRTNK